MIISLPVPESLLAFDTIFAEVSDVTSSRSAYARQFLGQMWINLTSITSMGSFSGQHRPERRLLQPTFDSRYGDGDLRLSSALRPLRVILHCLICGRKVTRQSAQEIDGAGQFVAACLVILAPAARGRKGVHRGGPGDPQPLQGRVDAQIFELDQEIALDRYNDDAIEAVRSTADYPPLSRRRGSPGIPLSFD